MAEVATEVIVAGHICLDIFPTFAADETGEKVLEERAAIESQEQIAQSTNHQQLHLAQVIQLALQERR